MTAHKKNPPAGGIRQQPTVRRRKIWAGPVALLLVVAALWWQWAQTQKQSQVGKAAPGVSSAAATISGVWQGEVTYSWGPTHTKRFLFEAEGDKLFGTATFLGFRRGTADGRIEGDKISFNVRVNEALEGMTTQRTNHYTGVLSGGEIHFTMQDDKEGLPIDFIVKKDG
jgi:hypothetical protein